MKLVWVIKLKHGNKIIWDNFKDAISDYKAFKSDQIAILIYPKIMSKKKFDSLKEFTGI